MPSIRRYLADSYKVGIALEQGDLTRDSWSLEEFNFKWGAGGIPISFKRFEQKDYIALLHVNPHRS